MLIAKQEASGHFQWASTTPIGKNGEKWTWKVHTHPLLWSCWPGPRMGRCFPRKASLQLAFLASFHNVFYIHVHFCPPCVTPGCILLYGQFQNDSNAPLEESDHDNFRGEGSRSPEKATLVKSQLIAACFKGSSTAVGHSCQTNPATFLKARRRAFSMATSVLFTRKLSNKEQTELYTLSWTSTVHSWKGNRDKHSATAFCNHATATLGILFLSSKIVCRDLRSLNRTHSRPGREQCNLLTPNTSASAFFFK